MIVRRLNDALRSGSTDEPTTALLAVVHGCGLHRSYFKDRTERERDRQILGLVGEHWAWRATRQCVSTIGLHAGT